MLPADDKAQLAITSLECFWSAEFPYGRSSTGMTKGQTTSGRLAQPKNTVLPLVGDVVTVRDMVAAFSEILGKPIQYREITDDQWTQNVSGAGLNHAALEHLTDLWRYLRTRSPEFQASYNVTDNIERIGGQPPRSLRQFLAEQAHLFSVGSQVTEAMRGTQNRP